MIVLVLVGQLRPLTSVVSARMLELHGHPTAK
jgi:hypothetical protein